jgi:hypothetical protein
LAGASPLTGLGDGYFVRSSSCPNDTQSSEVPDLNLPISGVAAVFVFIFLRLPIPSGTFREKIRRLDWMYDVR